LLLGGSQTAKVGFSRNVKSAAGHFSLKGAGSGACRLSLSCYHPLSPRGRHFPAPLPTGFLDAFGKILGSEPEAELDTLTLSGETSQPFSGGVSRCDPFFPQDRSMHFLPIRLVIFTLFYHLWLGNNNKVSQQ